MNPTVRSTPLAELVRSGPRVLRDTVIVTALIVGGSFLVRDRYTATTTVLPPRSGGDMLGALLGTSDVAALSRSLGLESASETNIYLAVLRSGTVKGTLIRKFDLMSVYHQKDPEKAGQRLSANTGITVTNEGLIRVAVTDRDRGRAADLANAYVDELDRVLQQNTNTSARRRREFLERRLEECRVDVAKAENALRDYQVAKRLPVAGLESEKTGDAVADLMAQRAQREVELGTLESASRTPMPRAEELRNELRQIDTQIITIPPAATVLGRLMREVKIQERVLLVLTEEYERARLLEQKDTPVVEVLDRAAPPLHKSFPRRTLIGLGAFLVVLAVNAVLTVARGQFRPAA